MTLFGPSAFFLTLREILFSVNPSAECGFCGLLGDFFNPNYLLRVFKKVLEQAGLPRMRFHDLRHSAATILLSMNVHPKVVQEMLGHSTINMTLDTYSHVLPSMQKDIIERWDDELRSSAEREEER